MDIERSLSPYRMKRAYRLEPKRMKKLLSSKYEDYFMARINHYLRNLDNPPNFINDSEPENKRQGFLFYSNDFSIGPSSFRGCEAVHCFH